MSQKKTKVTAAEIKTALAKKHSGYGSRDYFLTEVKSGATYSRNNLRILDAIAIKKSWTSPHITGYEVKISRSDFTGDAKFYTYLPLVHALYLVTPKGLVKREELPVEIGLIYYDTETKKLTVKKKPPPRDIEVSKDLLQYVIFSRLDPERIPFYSDKAEYWKDWLESKNENRRIGHMVAGEIQARMNRLESEIDALRGYRESGREKHEKLLKVMEKYGMPSWVCEPEKWLEGALKKDFPLELYDINVSLEKALAILKKIFNEKGENDNVVEKGD